MYSCVYRHTYRVSRTQSTHGTKIKHMVQQTKRHSQRYRNINKTQNSRDQPGISKHIQIAAETHSQTQSQVNDNEQHRGSEAAEMQFQNAGFRNTGSETSVLSFGK